uniref:Uncharacterized protein n=1 Tax=Oryza punctata TaxID=4537 RepID=A0A0E0MF62_ORYPU
MSTFEINISSPSLFQLWGDSLHHNELSSRAPSKVALFHQQLLETYGTSTNRASNARRTTARPNCKETVHSSIHETAMNFSNAPCVASIQMSSNDSQIGDTKSEKVLATTTAKSIVILRWKVSKQSNASGETATNKK